MMKSIARVRRDGQTIEIDAEQQPASDRDSRQSDKISPARQLCIVSSAFNDGRIVADSIDF